MPRNFIPSTDAGLRAFAINMGTLINVSPAAYGLTTAQAAPYQEYAADFSTALAKATDPATRGKATVFAKDQLKKQLIAMTRDLARIIQACPIVTDAQRLDLGLTVRKTEPTPVPVPSEIPDIDIMSRMGSTVKLKLHDGSSTRSGKPQGVAGARVYSFVGAQPPANVEDWKFEGATSRTLVEVDFPSTLPPGTLVWFTACWFNPRNQTGLGCPPVSTFLAGGAMNLAA